MTGLATITGSSAPCKVVKCWCRATAPTICRSLTFVMSPDFVRMVIENDLCGYFNLAGPRFTWAEFVKMLGAENIVWVSADIIKAAGVTEFELPLFRSERGARSGLMDVSNERGSGRRSHSDRARSHNAVSASLDARKELALRTFARTGDRADQTRPRHQPRLRLWDTARSFASLVRRRGLRRSASV